MKTIRLRLTLIEEALGTATADPDVYTAYIGSKAPDADTLEDEVEALGVKGVVEKGMTVFPKLADGTPIIYDYQIKGFFKDACGALQRMKGEKMAEESLKIKAYKKVIDGCIKVEPRQIPFDLHGMLMGRCERPLRAQTAQKEVIALACSETVPEESTINFSVQVPDIYEDWIMEMIKYGTWKGLLQWRNSGKGTFWYERLDDEGNVIGTNLPG